MSMKYTNSVGTKLDWRQRQLWGYVCRYKGLKSAEYIRQLILREIGETVKHKAFEKWLAETQKGEDTHEG